MSCDDVDVVLFHNSRHRRVRCVGPLHVPHSFMAPAVYAALRCNVAHLCLLLDVPCFFFHLLRHCLPRCSVSGMRRVQTHTLFRLSCGPMPVSCSRGTPCPLIRTQRLLARTPHTKSTAARYCVTSSRVPHGSYLRRLLPDAHYRACGVGARRRAAPRGRTHTCAWRAGRVPPERRHAHVVDIVCVVGQAVRGDLGV